MERFGDNTRRDGRALAVIWLLAGICCCRPVVAQPFPANPALPLATGAFVQLNYGLAAKSAAWWNTEVSAMRSVGIDTIIVQYVAYGQAYFYPTSVAGGTPYATDSIQRILNAADTRGMQVFLGVHLDTAQFSSGTFNLAANLAQGTATLNELNARYGTHGSLAGWYMPQEFSDYTVFYQPTLRDSLVSYTHELTALAHSSTSLPMMISPYFGQNPNGPAYAAWWNSTGLPGTNIDIFNMQDGVGTHRTTIAQSRAVFEAMAPVMAAHNVEFWGNNESFHQIHGWPVDNQAFAAVPTDINTFRQQLESTSPLVGKSTTFEYTTYLSTQGSAAANVLHQAYAAYFQDIVAPSWGDYSRNGVVDAGDYNIWRAAFGQSAALSADGNANGAIDAADYIVWRANAGAASGSTAADRAAVAEPTGLVPVLTALAMFGARRRGNLESTWTAIASQGMQR